MLEPVPLFGLGVPGRSLNAHAQKRVNLYTQVERDPEKGKLTIYPTPGLVSSINFGANPNRAAWEVGDYSYFVNAGTFWRVANDGTQTNLGTLATMGGRCDINDNGSQILIVDGPNGYIYSLASVQTISSITRTGTTATLTTAESHGLSTGMQVTVSGATPSQYNGTFTITVTDGNEFSYTMLSDPGASASPVGSYTINSAFVQIPDFPGGDTCDFMNGYFIVTVPESGQWNISGLYDGYTWDPLDFANAESSPDSLVRVMAINGQVCLFGIKTLEFWADSGALDFPLARIGASALEFGLAARWSLCKFMKGMAFLRRDKSGQVSVVLLQGYQDTPLSDTDLDNEISTYAAIEDATGFAFMKCGHPFYQINFPTANKSWLYDGQSGSWQEVRSSGGRHRGEIQIAYLNNAYVTDYENGKVYRIDENVYTDDGETIEREFISRHTATGVLTKLSQLCIDMEAGVGLALGQGQNPKLMLSVSRDGGHTYGAEIEIEIGQIGQYQARALVNRLGRARDWVFKVRVTDPVKTVFTGAWGKFGK